MSYEILVQATDSGVVNKPLNCFNWLVAYARTPTDAAAATRLHPQFVHGHPKQVLFAGRVATAALVPACRHCHSPVIGERRRCLLQMWSCSSCVLAHEGLRFADGTPVRSASFRPVYRSPPTVSSPGAEEGYMGAARSPLPANIDAASAHGRLLARWASPDADDDSEGVIHPHHDGAASRAVARQEHPLAECVAPTPASRSYNRRRVAGGFSSLAVLLLGGDALLGGVSGPR
ncbi:hypothetical protein GGX14DRAFT_570886 [Mycena pura]|uniref:Uncharacterized protein n=1 Tax=Mycena pura TaxID=153505 RepID=A0AAD6YCI0_9AGAR|nr:hypothetical protein GGX14DRAFT_570886 [Mycena pura]